MRVDYVYSSRIFFQQQHCTHRSSTEQMGFVPIHSERSIDTLWCCYKHWQSLSSLGTEHFKTTPTALGFVIWLPSCGEPIPICLAYSFGVEEGSHFYRAHPTSGSPVINGFSLACHTQTTHPSLNIVITENAKVVVKDDPFPPTSPGSKHAMERWPKIVR